jgi:hypothetical protein
MVLHSEHHTATCRTLTQLWRWTGSDRHIHTLDRRADINKEERIGKQPKEKSRETPPPTQPFFLSMMPWLAFLPQEAAEGRTAHNNGWNRANGTASNTLEPCFMYLIPFHWFRSSHYNEPLLSNYGSTNLLWFVVSHTVTHTYASKCTICTQHTRVRTILIQFLYTIFDQLAG